MVFFSSSPAGTLSLENNQFTGWLPNIFNETHFLSKLRINYNGFEGPLPETLAALTRLDSLDIDHTHLTGTIPNEICALVHEQSSQLQISADCKSKVTCACCHICF